MVIAGVDDHLRLDVDAEELRLGMLGREVREQAAGAAADLEDQGARFDSGRKRLGDELAAPAM